MKKIAFKADDFTFLFQFMYIIWIILVYGDVTRKWQTIKIWNPIGDQNQLLKNPLYI